MAKHNRVPRRRKKLNLTISTAARLQAEQLAQKQHRSLSNLFEHLVDLETRRVQDRHTREAAHDPPSRHSVERMRILPIIATASTLLYFPTGAVYWFLH